MLLVGGIRSTEMVIPSKSSPPPPNPGPSPAACFLAIELDAIPSVLNANLIKASSIRVCGVLALKYSDGTLFVQRWDAGARSSHVR